MKRLMDCDGFHQRLDAFRLGDLSSEAMVAMEDHARSCRDCALIWRVQDHLEAVSREAEGVASAPGSVADVWRGVERAISRRATVPVIAGGLPAGRWRLAAAAGLALVALGAGYLAFEVGRLRRQESALEERLSEQGRRLEELETAVSVGASAAARLSRTMLWEPLLERQGSVSVAEARSLLGALPPETTILSGVEAASLLERLSIVPGFGIREHLGEMDLTDGLQALEMTVLLDALNLDPDRRISTARVLALYRGSPETTR